MNGHSNHALLYILALPQPSQLTPSLALTTYHHPHTYQLERDRVALAHALKMAAGEQWRWAGQHGVRETAPGGDPTSALLVPTAGAQWEYAHATARFAVSSACTKVKSKVSALRVACDTTNTLTPSPLPHTSV